MRKARGVLTLVLLVGGLGYFLYSQQGEKAFNGYILQARPWLEQNDACLTKFSAWLERSEALDPAAADAAEQQEALHADLPPIVDEYRGVVQGLHAVSTDDAEIKPLKAQLDLYGSKRLEFLEQFQARVLVAPGEEQPEPDSDLVTQSDQALATFMALREAYFTKYDLHEEE